jgi:hypothetical protein
MRRAAQQPFLPRLRAELLAGVLHPLLVLRRALATWPAQAHLPPPRHEWNRPDGHPWADDTHRLPGGTPPRLPGALNLDFMALFCYTVSI